MPLEVNVDIAIDAPAHDVFEAIVDPAKMTKYFISRSSGRPEPGATLTWWWDDVGGECEVKVLEVEPDRLFSYLFPAEGGSKVTMEVE
jgi:uncharacterized protein YndB with AHSA1/START domain